MSVYALFELHVANVVQSCSPYNQRLKPHVESQRYLYNRTLFLAALSHSSRHPHFVKLPTSSKLFVSPSASSDVTLSSSPLQALRGPSASRIKFCGYGTRKGLYDDDRKKRLDASKPTTIISPTPAKSAYLSRYTSCVTSFPSGKLMV